MALRFGPLMGSRFCPVTPDYSIGACFSHAQAEKSCDKGKPSQQPRAICLAVVLGTDATATATDVPYPR